MLAIRLISILAAALAAAGSLAASASEPKAPPGTILSINGRQASPPDIGTAKARSAAGKNVTLKDRLEKDLRARRPQEFAFIARVVALVDAGVLPRRLVDSTYLWARTKRRHPFQYFQYALKLRARRIRVGL